MGAAPRCAAAVPATGIWLCSWRQDVGGRHGPCSPPGLGASLSLPLLTWFSSPPHLPASDLLGCLQHLVGGKECSPQRLLPLPLPGWSLHCSAWTALSADGRQAGARWLSDGRGCLSASPDPGAGGPLGAVDWRRRSALRRPPLACHGLPCLAPACAVVVTSSTPISHPLIASVRVWGRAAPASLPPIDVQDPGRVEGAASCGQSRKTFPACLTSCFHSGLPAFISWLETGHSTSWGGEVLLRPRWRP